MDKLDLDVNNMAKTIKQIADEIGVSKQAVRDKIAKLGLHGTLQRNANQICINEQQENLIKSAFLEKQSQSQTAKIDCDYIAQMQSEIAFLKEQIYVKDRQLEQAQKMIDQQQQLTLISENKLLLLEQKESTYENKKLHWWQRKK